MKYNSWRLKLLFDFVILTSVFTHMLPHEVDRYLSEIGRVLKPGGKAFITFFLLNKVSRAYIRLGASGLDFKHEWNGCLVVDLKEPELAIAHDEQSVQALFEKHQLELQEPIYYGSWCGRREHYGVQDIVVSTRI